MNRWNEPRTSNGVIEYTFLGIEDHGILTAIVGIAGEGWGQGFGNYWLGGPGAALFIRRTLETVGVREWEKLKGKNVRIVHTDEKVLRIGHIIEDRWFDPAEELNAVKEQS